MSEARRMKENQPAPCGNGLIMMFPMLALALAGVHVLYAEQSDSHGSPERGSCLLSSLGRRTQRPGRRWSWPWQAAMADRDPYLPDQVCEAFGRIVCPVCSFGWIGRRSTATIKWIAVPALAPSAR